MTVQNLYTQYLDGKITKQKFLYEVRRDQHLDMISSSNSFDDVVKILKNKSIISEKAHKEAKLASGKQEVEVIAKTIDMVNPYEYTRGMEFELNIMDVSATSGDLSEDSILKAQKKVLANLTKNSSFYFDKINGKGEVGHEWIEATKKEIEKIGKGKSKMIREGYSAVLDLPNGYYFAIDDDWEDEYQGKNGMFFTISGNNIYDKDGKSVQSSPREFLSQFTPEEILKVPSTDKKSLGEGVENGLKQMGYSDSDIEDFMDEYKQGGSKLPKKVRDYLDSKKGMKKEGIETNKFSNTFSNKEILRAIAPYGKIKEFIPYMQSLRKSGDEFENLDDYIEDFRNYIADKSLEEGLGDKQYLDALRNSDANSIESAKKILKRKFKDLDDKNIEYLAKEWAKRALDEAARPGYHADGTPKSNDEMSDDEREAFYNDSDFLDEHGQYAGRVADVNADSTPLKEREKAIYEKYAQKFNKSIDELKAMVEASTYAGKDAVDDLKKDPKYSTLSSTAKIDSENKLKKGETVTIG